MRDPHGHRAHPTGRPTHPRLAAALLVIGVAVLVVALAAFSTF